jgi:hypothetical protein
VSPDDGWFIALAVLSGISVLGWWSSPVWSFTGRGRRWQEEW